MRSHRIIVRVYVYVCACENIQAELAQFGIYDTKTMTPTLNVLCAPYMYSTYLVITIFEEILYGSQIRKYFERYTYTTCTIITTYI